MHSLLSQIRLGARKFGLNLVAAVAPAAYDSTVSKPLSRISSFSPATRSVVVLANGGKAFWRHFRHYAAEHPGWTARRNPLDDYTATIVEQHLVAPLRQAAVACRAVFPFAAEEPQLNFLELGKLSGLGGPSIIGVLVNRTYGPWFAFRAALLLDEALLDDRSRTPALFDPCPSCVPRSCIAACPVGAVRSPQGWDVYKCLEHRVEVEPDCATRCHARVGCVLAPHHRYDDDELEYHQRRALAVMKPYYLEKIKGRTTG